MLHKDEDTLGTSYIKFSIHASIICALAVWVSMPLFDDSLTITIAIVLFLCNGGNLITGILLNKKANAKKSQ